MHITIYIYTLLSLFLITGCSNKSQYHDRTFYNARLEPKNGILHGAGQDFESFRIYTENVKKKNYPVLYMTYVNLTAADDEFVTWYSDIKEQFNQLPKSVIPQLGLSMVRGKETGLACDSLVARGVYDARIDSLIAALKSLERPCYIRIGYEFDGSWNGYNSKYFPGAFIHITKAIRESGLDAATVWCSAGGSAGFQSAEQYMQYYPGDEFVDWWGIDIFSADEFSNPSMSAFLANADKHGKPVMIGETTPRYVGVLDGEISWNTWFAPYFSLLKENAGIKAVSYINWDWYYWSETYGFNWHDWGDARLEMNSYVLDAYKSEISDPIFIHAY